MKTRANLEDAGIEDKSAAAAEVAIEPKYARDAKP
jgi:hypothetical protein